MTTTMAAFGKSIAHHLAHTADQVDYVEMLALMAYGRPYRLEDRYHHAHAMLADGSSIAVQGSHFIFECRGDEFARRPAPPHAVLPHFKGPINQWQVNIALSVAVSKVDQPFPQNALAAAVRGALVGITKAQVSVSGLMDQEAARAAFPSTPLQDIMGVNMQHGEGPSVLRPEEAYNHQLHELVNLINPHTNVERVPRAIAS